MQYVCKCDESKNLKARKAHQSQCLKWSARGGGGGLSWRWTIEWPEATKG